MTEPRPLLTAAEVAERLRVSRGSVYRGLPGLRPVRIGRRVRYRPDDVERVARGEPAEAEAKDDPTATPSGLDREVAQKLGDVVVDALGPEHPALLQIEARWNKILGDEA